MSNSANVLYVYDWERERCLLHRVVGCPLFRDFSHIEVYGETVGTFRIVCYIVGVLLLMGVHLVGFHCSSLTDTHCPCGHFVPSVHTVICHHNNKLVV